MNQSNEIVVVDAVAVPRRPRKLLLRKALWANTWLLLSLAVASKRLFAASAVNSVNVDAQGNAYIESQELEVSEDYDMSHETSWATDNLFDKEHEEDEKGIIVVATIDGSIAGLCHGKRGMLFGNRRAFHSLNRTFPQVTIPTMAIRPRS
jgi:hypothetical protein